MLDTLSSPFSLPLPLSLSLMQHSLFASPSSIVQFQSSSGVAPFTCTQKRTRKSGLQEWRLFAGGPLRVDKFYVSRRLSCRRIQRADCVFAWQGTTAGISLRDGSKNKQSAAMDDRKILREHTVIGLLDVGVRKMKMNPIWSPTGKRKDAALGPGRRAQAVAGITGMSTTVVSPSSGYALWTVLVVCAAIGKVLECRTSWGSRISAPLLAMGVGMVLSSLRIIPASAPAYDMVWKGLMPIAVALCVMERDLRHIANSAGVALTAFWVGALATVIGTVVSYFLVGRSLGSNGWKIAACLCATYIGGSINYAATAQALGLSSGCGGSLLAAGMAADNLATAAYLATIMGIPEKDKLDGQAQEGKDCHAPKNDVHEAEKGDTVTIESVILSLACASAACSLGRAVAAGIPQQFAGADLGIMTLIAAGISSLIAAISEHKKESKNRNKKSVDEQADNDSYRNTSTKVQCFAGAEKLGGALMLIYFSVIGANAALGEALAGGWNLILMEGIILAIHLGIILLVGKMMGMPLRAVLIASNANVGGPATAAAMASARSWPEMVQPALLTGTLGYVIGTAVGCAVGGLLHLFP